MVMSRKDSEFYTVQKALSGDQRAFTTLYNSYHRSLLYQIKKIVRDEEVAMDITMETFEKAFQALHRYSPEYAFSTWLFRIGINCAIDYIRNNKNKPDSIIELDKQMMFENDDQLGYQLKCPDKTPDEQLMTEQRLYFMREVVTLLPRWQRRLIELRYIDDFTYNEIADELGMPLGTVKGMLHRAKEVLIDIVNKNWSVKREVVKE
nr:MAG TPA: RNA polymerase sigma factor [Herelleviridae sp.]